MILIRKTKRGRYRAYEIQKQALMSWRGDNNKATVLRDEDGAIIEHDNVQDLCAQLNAWPAFVNMFGRITEHNVVDDKVAREAGIHVPRAAKRATHA